MFEEGQLPVLTYQSLVARSHRGFGELSPDRWLSVRLLINPIQWPDYVDRIVRTQLYLRYASRPGYDLVLEIQLWLARLLESATVDSLDCQPTHNRLVPRNARFSVRGPCEPFPIRFAPIAIPERNSPIADLTRRYMQSGAVPYPRRVVAIYLEREALETNLWWDLRENWESYAYVVPYQVLLSRRFGRL